MAVISDLNNVRVGSCNIGMNADIARSVNSGRNATRIMRPVAIPPALISSHPTLGETMSSIMFLKMSIKKRLAMAVELRFERAKLLISF